MAEYYAIVRNDDYIAHYGIKGMRWHVRKAIGQGNKKAYDKQRRKANKKFERLKKHASDHDEFVKKALITGGLVATSIANPSQLAYKVGKTGYNTVKALRANKSANKVKEWEKAMKEEFDDDIMYRMYFNNKRRKHKR